MGETIRESSFYENGDIDLSLLIMRLNKKLSLIFIF